MSATSSSRGKRSAVVVVTSPSPVREPGASLPRSGVASSLTPRISGHLMAAAVTSSASEGSITCSPSSKTQAAEVIQRVETWAQAEILSDDEAWDFRTQDTLDTQGRKSMLPGDGRRSGIAMDMANKYSNKLLQRGKTALESAIECLQSLYETCLALSDSRSRHMLSLEREKSRHAREIIVIERAHNKKIAEVTKDLTSEVALARNDLAMNLEQTKAIRSWLGYETLEPYKRIEDILKSTMEIKTTVARWNHSQ